MARRIQVPREAWLRSKSHDVYAAAISECKNGDPSWCSAHERCRFGDCFVDSHIAHGRRELRCLVTDLIRLGKELKTDAARHPRLSLVKVVRDEL